MKLMNYLIFFSIVLSVYGLLNFYLFTRGWQALPEASGWRTPYLVCFLVLSLAFIAGRFLERAWISPVSDLLVWIGSFWLAAMLYFFLAAVVIDLFRLANAVVPFFPSWVGGKGSTFTLRLFEGVVGAVILLLMAGHVNALTPRVHPLRVAVEKRLRNAESLRVVVASDIHLGTIVGRSRFEKIVERINALEPDLILLPGDIVDEDLAPVLRQNLGETLRKLRARYGVLAVTGNHEYIGGVEEAVRYLRDHGVTMLRDSAVQLDNGVTIVGREDRSITQFTHGVRRPLRDIMAGVDTSMPVILLDHQPFGLNEARENGVDVQLSGHTHHGQLWPLNLITNALYEVSWGMKQVNGSVVYVSSGLGTWGPPVRLGNRPEIVVLTLSSAFDEGYR